MRTRGKRVTAEATIKREHLLEVMRVDPKQIDYHGRVAGVGSFLSGVNNTAHIRLTASLPCLSLPVRMWRTYLSRLRL